MRSDDTDIVMEVANLFSELNIELSEEVFDSYLGSLEFLSSKSIAECLISMYSFGQEKVDKAIERYHDSDSDEIKKAVDLLRKGYPSL